MTFGRAGEDNKRFKLGSVEQTLAGFAGADYQLQARVRIPNSHLKTCFMFRQQAGNYAFHIGLQDNVCDIFL